MADTIKSTSELKIEFSFYDNDTRTVSLDNPKDNLTATQVNQVVTLAKNTQPIIGDKGSARVVGANSAKVIEKTVTNVDLTIE